MGDDDDTCSNCVDLYGAEIPVLVTPDDHFDRGRDCELATAHDAMSSFKEDIGDNTSILLPILHHAMR